MFLRGRRRAWNIVEGNRRELPYAHRTPEAVGLEHVSFEASVWHRLLQEAPRSISLTGIHGAMSAYLWPVQGSEMSVSDLPVGCACLQEGAVCCFCTKHKAAHTRPL